MFYWDIFKLKPHKEYTSNMGVFYEDDNAKIEEILKKPEKKQKKPNDDNPEIPTVQIGGVSWEYLRLKKKI